MKYKQVWLVVIGLCVLGFLLMLLGGVINGGLIIVGIAVIIGAIVGGYTGKFIGVLTAGIVGSIIWSFIILDDFSSIIESLLLCGIIYGIPEVITGSITGWWSKKKKKSIDSEMKSEAHQDEGREPSADREEIQEPIQGPSSVFSQRTQTPPPPPPTDEGSDPAEIRKSISDLQEEENMIDTRDIESALEDGNVERAEALLEELTEDYQEYKETIKELDRLDDRKSALAEKLASDDIDGQTFKDAKEDIEHKKAYLEEKLNTLRKKVIHEDYEKPF